MHRPHPRWRTCIEDIAHALSLICRGNGHVKTFWSVGQHCINCAKEAWARGLPNRMALACLLHDAGECYLSDVPSPFKRVLPDYRAYENRLLELIYRRYLGSPLSDKEQSDLDGIDHAMLDRDLACLLGETQAEKPDLIVSAGAAPAVPFFYIGKLMGAKTIFIEAYDRIDKASLTGKLCYRASDVFIVQWEPMLKVFPKAKYLGSIF